MYVDEEKVTEHTRMHLNSDSVDGVNIVPYEAVWESVKLMANEATKAIWLPAESTSYSLASQIQKVLLYLTTIP